MRILTVLAAVLMLGVVRVVPAAAQIDPVSAVNGSLSAAQQAGVAITALVVLGGGLLISGGGVLLWYRDRQATRASQREERKLTREAMTDASTVNKLLLDRLDKLTEAIEKIAANVGGQTEAVDNLMGAVDSLMKMGNDLIESAKAAEKTREDRYATLIGRQDNVEAAAKKVADELHGVKQSVDGLVRKVEEAKTLSEADRTAIRALTGKVDALLHKLEGGEHETGTGDSGGTDVGGADDGAGGSAGDGAGAGGSNHAV